MGNAFFYVIDRLRRVMGAKNASAGNLAMLERLFMQALDNRILGPREGDVQYSVAPKDEALVDFYRDVMSMKDKNARSKRKKKLGPISDVQAEIISDVFRKELGIEIDLTGYELWIGGDAVDHIDRRHGVAGKENQTMSDMDDVAKIPWVANNAQYGELVREKDGTLKRDAVYENSDGSKAYQVGLGRVIDGSVFYVVECVPDSKLKRVQIKSAYKKSGKGQLLNLNSKESRQLTPEALVDGNATDTNVAQKTPGVKYHSMQEGAGVYSHGVQDGVQGALLPPEYRPGARAEGVDPNANVEGVTESPLSPDGDIPPLGKGGTDAAGTAMRAIRESPLRCWFEIAYNSSLLTPHSSFSCHSPLSCGIQ